MTGSGHIGGRYLAGRTRPGAVTAAHDDRMTAVASIPDAHSRQRSLPDSRITFSVHADGLAISSLARNNRPSTRPGSSAVISLRTSSPMPTSRALPSSPAQQRSEANDSPNCAVSEVTPGELIASIFSRRIAEASAIDVLEKGACAANMLSASGKFLALIVAAIFPASR